MISTRKSAVIGRADDRGRRYKHLLSAALRDRLPERVVLFIATNDAWKWLVTPVILAEYSDVLKRPKFKLGDDVLRKWSELLSLRTVVVTDPSSLPSPNRDPKDAPFLAAAVASVADYLITGDQDLLVLNGTISTKILTVSAFAAAFQIKL